MSIIVHACFPYLTALLEYLNFEYAAACLIRPPPPRVHNSAGTAI